MLGSHKIYILDFVGSHMTIENVSYTAASPPAAVFESVERRTAASYERALTSHRRTELRLRDALAREEALLRQKDAFIQKQEVLSKESDHRLLNGLQMIASLLSLQSRAATNSEAASQLSIAANRVAMIARVHRRLHSFDGVQTIAFKPYLEDLCHDFSTMLTSEQRPDQIIVEGIDVDLPVATGNPLGFIVSELITNAVKYGKGRNHRQVGAQSTTRLRAVGLQRRPGFAGRI